MRDRRGRGRRAAAHRKAHACDPLSAFVGVIAVKPPVTVELAEQVAEIFTEVIAAPGYEDGAVEILAKKKNIRVLKVDGTPHQPGDLKPVSGGALLQQSGRVPGRGRRPRELDAGHRRGPLRDELAELAFAWKACRAVKSNAILLAKDGASVGVGMGQVNRVDSAKLAGRAGPAPSARRARTRPPTPSSRSRTGWRS
ncbi:hypothetical protein ACFSNO_27815 [Streptomyces cirratus]